jgi:hypothetical protein
MAYHLHSNTYIYIYYTNEASTSNYFMQITSIQYYTNEASNSNQSIPINQSIHPNTLNMWFTFYLFENQIQDYCQKLYKVQSHL